MSEPSGTKYQIYVVLALLMLITCAQVVCAEDINRTIIVPVNESEIANNSSILVDLSTTIPVTEGIRNTTQLPDLINIQPRQIQPVLQRKISTNLLYLIDANATQTGFSREQAAERLKSNGQMKVERRAASVVNGATADATTQPLTNQVYVFIELNSLASTHVVDAYIPNVTERNDDELYVIGWVDIDDLETIAALDLVTNVRTAEPSVTKASPFYHDTQFVNKRVKPLPATSEEAKASVRAFENAPSMALEQKGTMKTPRGDVYDMASNSARYHVNAKTGDVEMVSFSSQLSVSQTSGSNSDRVLSEKKSGIISIDQAYIIANNYAGKNYRNFNNRTMVLTQNVLLDHGDAGKEYYLQWYEKINDVYSPNWVVVMVDQESGRINSYINSAQAVQADMIPTISRNDAIDKMLNEFSGVENPTLESQLFIYTKDGGQRLVWYVRIDGNSQTKRAEGGYSYIDAHLGEIVETGRYN